MRTALVTGEQGFVGRHMRRALEQRNWHVLGVDLAIGTDAHDIFRSDFDCDLVVHCAAHVGGRVDIDGRPLYLAAKNLQLDSAMFAWALRTRPGRIVYFSSSAAYPTALQTSPGLRLVETDIDLAHPRAADASYGAVKLTGERLAALANDAGIPTHVFRPFSGYGGDQDPDYPFRAFLLRALRRADPFDIWGDGQSTRDWVHISDVVDGVLACLDADADADADVRGPINLCTGVATTFDDLARLFTDAAGYTADLRHDPGAPQGVAHRVGDPTMLAQVYTPRVTIEQGVKDAVTEAMRRR